MNGRDFREIASSIRELSMTYKDFGNVVSETANTVNPLKKLVGESDVDGKGKGSKLIAAGIALIAFPDPTISDVMGVSLIAAGLMKNKMKQPTIADMHRSFHDAMRELGAIKTRNFAIQ